jgi:hypothetical protein
MCVRTHLLVLASLLLLLTACTFQRPQAASSNPNIPQIFTRTQYPEDTRSGTLPEHLTDTSDIDPDSLRLLGMQGSHAFYAARNESGDICLLNVIDIPGVAVPTIGRSCATPQRFAQRGVAVFVQSGPYAAGAVFFPDSYTDSVRKTLPNAFVPSNLLAYTSDEAITRAIDTHGGEVIISGDGQDDLIISLSALR